MTGPHKAMAAAGLVLVALFMSRRANAATVPAAAGATAAAPMPQVSSGTAAGGSGLSGLFDQLASALAPARSYAPAPAAAPSYPVSSPVVAELAQATQTINAIKPAPAPAPAPFDWHSIEAGVAGP